MFKYKKLITGGSMKKIVKVFVGISFAIYIFALVVILFLIHRGHWTEISLFEYMKRFSNFVPFSTISTYIQAILTGNINLDILVKNLLGNLLLFLPMGVYLPFYFRKLAKPSLFVISMLVLLFIVETTQITTRRGSFDIDDLILNMIGALIGFGIWKIPFVQKKIQPYFQRR